MPKASLAFLLGFIGFLLLFFIVEPATHHLGDVGLIPTFLLMAVYFFICQFQLSRGNPNAHRKDWPVMLALDAVCIAALFVMILSERLEVVLAQGIGILVSCFGATWAGAFAAAKKAGRKENKL
jgi:hypothetical protein